MIQLIACIAANSIIGTNNHLPRPRIAIDMQFFFEKTKNSDLVMGKNTYLSLGRHLPHRHHHVLSTSQDVPLYAPDSVTLYSSANQRYDRYKKNNHLTISCIGGASIYQLFLGQDRVDMLWLTHLQDSYPGDVAFPFDAREQHNYTRIAHQERSENDHSGTFVCRTKTGSSDNTDN